MRTCIGCRARSAAGTLVRVVRGPEGALHLDRVAPGRGAWLCRLCGTDNAVPDCAVLAAKRGAFSRALRGDVPAAQVALLVATVTERARIRTEGELRGQVACDTAGLH